MREFSAPATVTVESDENLTDAIFANAERFPHAVSIRKRSAGLWTDVTAAEFAAEVTGVAKGLIATGLQPGDRIGVLSKTRYEWTLLDYAIWTAGCASVPIYESSSAGQIQWVLSNSGARAAIVETAMHRTLLDSVTADLDKLEHVWQIEGPGGDSGSAAVGALLAAGSAIEDEEVRQRRRSIGSEDLATLIYTSGTTGRPKGCQLSHRNLLAEVRSDIAAFPQMMRPDSSLLLFLPLAHVLARTIQCACLYSRVTVGHSPDVKHLLEDMSTFRPTFLLAVPRVFEKVYNSAKRQALADGKGAIFERAERCAVAYSKAADASGPGITLRAAHAVFDRLVYGRLRGALGGRCVAAISGGAPLGQRLTHFFRGIGVPVMEGYGLTETTAAATVNTEHALKPGTVGRPVAGTAVRIAEDGEILISGDIVFAGYWDNPEASAESLEGGWFYTGDLGELDEEGFLRITGRKKDLLVTAGGKNVAPSGLEDQLRMHPLISQCMVVGDGRPFIGALLTLDEEFLPQWRAQHDKTELPATELAGDPELRAELQRAVDEANATVSRAESIRQFRVLEKDFTEENGELTPSMKLKRGVVSSRYQEQIEALYS